MTLKMSDIALMHDPRVSAPKGGVFPIPSETQSVRPHQYAHRQPKQPDFASTVATINHHDKPVMQLRGVKERYRAVIMRIGDEPLLSIDSVGEFRFAYRNVKKKPGESRPFLQVGDEVECRLTKSAPPKAVSLRVTKQIQQQPAFSHDPYNAPLVGSPSMHGVCEAESLSNALGGTVGINEFVETVCTLHSHECASTTTHTHTHTHTVPDGHQQRSAEGDLRSPAAAAIAAAAAAAAAAAVSDEPWFP